MDIKITEHVVGGCWELAPVGVHDQGKEENRLLEKQLSDENKTVTNHRFSLIKAKLNIIK